MTSAILTVSREERDVLHGLMCRRLFILGMKPLELARKENASLEEVAEGFGEDMRLMNELGWEFEGTSSSVDLTMPAESLGRTLRRLRRDARRAPSEVRHEREPNESSESDEDRWQRFRRGVEVCEEVLKRLDPGLNWATLSSPVASIELGPYTAVPDELILAAIERAELHEQAGEAYHNVVTEHLGFTVSPETNGSLFPRLEGLKNVGWLTSSEKRGEPYWGLSEVGREHLASRREAGAVGELPESPQHRTWRHARVNAAVRFDQFQRALAEAMEAAYDLLYQHRPALSEEWLSMSERLRWTTWRVGSALYCLTEWVEPSDDKPDVDESPGPRPGRRATWAWDQLCSVNRPGGSP